MPFRIPFTTSRNNQELRVPIGNTMYLFKLQWNSKEVAWYLDLLNEDETPISVGMKLVLGVLGKRSGHPFFQNNVLVVIDTTGNGLDPGFDDLDVRVILQLTTISDLAGIV